MPEDKIGSIYEDVGSREAMRQGVIMSIQERFGDVNWEEGYINTGFFVVSKSIQISSRESINDQHYGQVLDFDDALLGYNIHKFGHEVHELSFQFNHMSMFSEVSGMAKQIDLTHMLYIMQDWQGFQMIGQGE